MKSVLKAYCPWSSSDDRVPVCGAAQRTRQSVYLALCVPFFFLFSHANYKHTIRYLLALALIDQQRPAKQAQAPVGPVRGTFAEMDKNIDQLLYIVPQCLKLAVLSPYARHTYY